MKNNIKGITLIELLTVIGIIVILAAISLPSYASVKNSLSLSSETKEVVNALKVAQNMAITSQGGTTFGVRFETNKYVLCNNDCSSDGTDDLSETGKNTKNSFSLSGTDNIIFNRLDGRKISGNPYITLGGTKNINVNEIGKIFITQT